jgi:uridine phosphorylase
MVTFKIIEGISAVVLERLVNAKLNMGWKLHGGVVVQNDKFYQALTITHRKTVKIPK